MNDRSAMYDPETKSIRLRHEQVHWGWSALIIAAALIIWLVLLNKVNAVKSVWGADGSLKVVSGRSGVVVTHLSYPNARERTYYVATLPRPQYEPGEYGPVFSPEALRSLEWRDRNGKSGPPPTPRDEVRAVYYRPRLSLPVLPD